MIGSIIQLLSTFVKWADAWWTKREVTKERNQRREEIDQVAKTTEQIKHEVKPDVDPTESVADLNDRFGWNPKS